MRSIHFLLVGLVCHTPLLLQIVHDPLRLVNGLGFHVCYAIRQGAKLRYHGGAGRRLRGPNITQDLLKFVNQLCDCRNLIHCVSLASA